VEHGHNYFVLAQHDMTTSGSPPVLVHNMCAVNTSRYNGSKPQYTVNPAHVPSTGQGFNWKKTPLPKDAEEVFKKAVPSDATNPKHWFGKASDGTFYRYSNSNDGTAHFSGIFNFNELPSYVKSRFGR
jgi:hypothetical protein